MSLIQERAKAITLAVNEAVKMNKVDKAMMDNLESSTQITLDEHFKAQEGKSLAVSEGKISLELATELYELLGNTPSQFNKQPYAVRFVVLAIVAGLIRNR